MGDFDEALLGRMADAIEHRGPDASGIWHDPDVRVGLAHRRLSIIDLSARGVQPMWDATRSVAVSYNGEIYNYRELRKDLEADGFRFENHTDTEVLLNLYRRDGIDMLRRLNGIFAFALWDTRRRALLLARDGLGVKPLYFAEIGKGVVFASELKALLQCEAIPRTLDAEAVRSYLTYLWCPAPRTMLESVHKLEPGHALWVQDGRVSRTECFYELPFDRPALEITEQEAIARVEAQVREAVRRQMVADVPVGAFLSGGLDSSSIVNFAREHAGGALDCYTIGFGPGFVDREGVVDDLPYARRVAKQLEVDLHVIDVDPQIAHGLPRMIYQLDEPQADLAALLVGFIAKLARDRGSKVLLSGAGGDDIFSGYRRHFAVRQEAWWGWLPRPIRGGIRGLSNHLPTALPFSRRVAKAFRYADRSPDERIAGYFHWIDTATSESLLGPAVRGNRVNGSFSAPLMTSLAELSPDTPRLQKMLYLDTKHFLADHNLNYTDKMSMASGVEVRVPLLDPDLVELVARLPVSLKFRGRTGKRILKSAMAPYLPHDVIHRPKTGFGVPWRRWLREELRPLVDDVVGDPAFRRRGLFEPAALKNLVDADRAGQVDAAYPILAVLCIELWCRTFVDASLPTPLG